MAEISVATDYKSQGYGVLSVVAVGGDVTITRGAAEIGVVSVGEPKALHFAELPLGVYTVTPAASAVVELRA